jgi:hypothetical protein
LAYSAISTIYKYIPNITYYWGKSDTKNTILPCFVNKHIKKYSYAKVYLWVEITLFGRSLYNVPLYVVYLDNELKECTYYFVGSEGGSLAYCKGYDINKVRSREDFMEEDHEGEPKTQEHYKGRIIERGELDDDDKTSYEMSKLIYNNLVDDI